MRRASAGWGAACTGAFVVVVVDVAVVVVVFEDKGDDAGDDDSDGDDDGEEENAAAYDVCNVEENGDDGVDAITVLSRQLAGQGMGGVSG